jgi:hypothetical protein
MGPQAQPYCRVLGRRFFSSAMYPCSSACLELPDDPQVDILRVRGTALSTFERERARAHHVDGTKHTDTERGGCAHVHTYMQIYIFICAYHMTSRYEIPRHSNVLRKPPSCVPLSSEHSTCKRVKATFQAWLSGRNPSHILSGSPFARKRFGAHIPKRNAMWRVGGVFFLITLTPSVEWYTSL